MDNLGRISSNNTRNNDLGNLVLFRQRLVKVINLRREQQMHKIQNISDKVEQKFSKMQNNFNYDLRQMSNEIRDNCEINSRLFDKNLREIQSEETKDLKDFGSNLDEMGGEISNDYTSGENTAFKRMESDNEIKVVSKVQKEFDKFNKDTEQRSNRFNSDLNKTPELKVRGFYKTSNNFSSNLDKSKSKTPDNFIENPKILNYNIDKVSELNTENYRQVSNKDNLNLGELNNKVLNIEEVVSEVNSNDLGYDIIAKAEDEKKNDISRTKEKFYLKTQNKTIKYAYNFRKAFRVLDNNLENIEQKSNKIQNNFKLDSSKIRDNMPNNSQVLGFNLNKIPDPKVRGFYKISNNFSLNLDKSKSKTPDNFIENPKILNYNIDKVSELNLKKFGRISNNSEQSFNKISRYNSQDFYQKSNNDNSSFNKTLVSNIQSFRQIPNKNNLYLNKMLGKTISHNSVGFIKQHHSRLHLKYKTQQLKVNDQKWWSKLNIQLRAERARYGLMNKSRKQYLNNSRPLWQFQVVQPKRYSNIKTYQSPKIELIDEKLKTNNLEFVSMLRYSDWCSKFNPCIYHNLEIRNKKIYKKFGVQAYQFIVKYQKYLSKIGYIKYILNVASQKQQTEIEIPYWQLISNNSKFESKARYLEYQLKFAIYMYRLGAEHIRYNSMTKSRKQHLNNSRYWWRLKIDSSKGYSKNDIKEYQLKVNDQGQKSDIKNVKSELDIKICQQQTWGPNWYLKIIQQKYKSKIAQSRRYSIVNFKTQQLKVCHPESAIQKIYPYNKIKLKPNCLAFPLIKFKQNNTNMYINIFLVRINMESSQHILDRVRSPRVHITYDVEIGNAIQMKELPFVVGIIADLSGVPLNPLPKLKFRKFVDIDRDNFNDIMASIAPRLVFNVAAAPALSNKAGEDTSSTAADESAAGAAATNATATTAATTTATNAATAASDGAATDTGTTAGVSSATNGLGATLGIELVFKNMDDFGPVAVLKQVPVLNKLYEARVKLCDLVTKLEGNDSLQELLKLVIDQADLQVQLKQQITDHQNAANNGTPIEVKETDILQRIFKEGKLARSKEAEGYACDMLLEFLNQLVKEEGSIGSVIVFAEKTISNIELVLEDQINEIIHEPKFQELEGTWRGLNYLVMNTETSVHLKLRVLNATKKELLDDVEKAIEFDQSALFKKIYEEEYGTFGGNPYSCLVGSYEFNRHPQDIELLSKLSNIAAAAHAPFIAAASPRLFDFDSFIHLGEPRDLAKIFESTEMIKWRSFRNQEDSRYVALTLPHVLMRLPYGPETLPVDGLNFHESISGPDNSKFCWGNAAFVLAQRITNAVALYNWPAAIRGVESGGLVENLPSYTFKTTDGDIALKCPTEIAITDRREKELTDLGFIAICHSKGTDFAAFFGGQTVQKPKIYNTDSANANAALSTKLPYMLAASRFAHYIKSIMRDKVGSFLTKDNVAQYLNNWITNYVLLNDDASQDMKAKMPLREARVDVFDVPGKPGYYKATIFLRPHFQLEGLTASIRLVATLPPPPAA